LVYGLIVQKLSVAYVIIQILASQYKQETISINEKHKQTKSLLAA